MKRWLAGAGHAGMPKTWHGGQYWQLRMNKPQVEFIMWLNRKDYPFSNGRNAPHRQRIGKAESWSCPAASIFKRTLSITGWWIRPASVRSLAIWKSYLKRKLSVRLWNGN